MNQGKSSREEHFEESLKSTKKNHKFGAWQWLYENVEASEVRRPRFSSGDYSDLNGVPIGFKDIFNSIDGTTEMGSELWKNHNAGNDARIIAIASEAGCSVLGKTTTSEFAVHALPETYNPWDIARTPGTSSSGSAVSVVNGDVPIAFGTQTAGSISRPASFCGVIGFKPTFGIFPRTGVLKTCDPFDTIGFFCSHYEDVELIFNSTRLKGSNYPMIEKGLEFTLQEIQDSKETIIGRVVTDSNTYEEQEISDSINNFLSSLPAKYKIETCDLTDVLSSVRELQEVIYHKSLSYYFSEERASGTEYSSFMKSIFAEGDEITSEQYIESIYKLEDLRSLIVATLSKFHLLLSPTTSSIAPLRGQIETIDSSLYWTMLHLPLVSLPLFRDKKLGMPFGLQIVGTKKYSEQYIFEFIKDLDLTDLEIDRPNNLII